MNYSEDVPTHDLWFANKPSPLPKIMPPTVSSKGPVFQTDFKNKKDKTVQKPDPLKSTAKKRFTETEIKNLRNTNNTFGISLLNSRKSDIIDPFKRDSIIQTSVQKSCIFAKTAYQNVTLETTKQFQQKNLQNFDSQREFSSNKITHEKNEIFNEICDIINKRVFWCFCFLFLADYFFVTCFEFCFVFGKGNVFQFFFTTQILKNFSFRGFFLSFLRVLQLFLSFQYYYCQKIVFFDKLEHLKNFKQRKLKFLFFLVLELFLFKFILNLTWTHFFSTEKLIFSDFNFAFSRILLFNFAHELLANFNFTSIDDLLNTSQFMQNQQIQVSGFRKILLFPVIFVFSIFYTYVCFKINNSNHFTDFPIFGILNTKTILVFVLFFFFVKILPGLFFYFLRFAIDFNYSDYRNREMDLQTIIKLAKGLKNNTFPKNVYETKLTNIIIDQIDRNRWNWLVNTPSNSAMVNTPNETLNSLFSALFLGLVEVDRSIETFNVFSNFKKSENYFERIFNFGDSSNSQFLQRQNFVVIYLNSQFWIEAIVALKNILILSVKSQCSLKGDFQMHTFLSFLQVLNSRLQNFLVPFAEDADYADKFVKCQKVCQALENLWNVMNKVLSGS